MGKAKNSSVSIERPAFRYAEVALDRPLEQILSYGIPAALAAEVRIGSMVEAPLRTQTAKGVVLSLSDQKTYGGPIKSLARVLTPDYALSPELMELGRWLAGYYWCSLGEALSAIAFFGLNDVHSKIKTHLALAEADHWLTVSREVGPDGLKATPRHARVIHALLAGGNEPMAPGELRDEAGVGDGVLHMMLKRHWLVRVYEPVSRDDDYAKHDGPESGTVAPALTLTPEQSYALNSILETVHAERHHTFLLHGVTGSGKTEVYLRAIEAGLRLGRSAIVLVPEIALTPQTVATFRTRLGMIVGVYHSRLTLGQKHDLWKKIVAGEVRVLVGARSAIFAPLPNLGLIVVDEEHETTYKQGDTPRYHARDVAVWRASRCKAVAVLGSATPSLESFHNAREGKYTLVSLPFRIGPHAAPVMTVIDMKKHLIADCELRIADSSTPGAQSKISNHQSTTHNLQSGNPQSLISSALRSAIEKRLAANEQTILLLNRRGFANHVLCLKCEKPLQCPHCDVPLTYHKYGKDPEARDEDDSPHFDFSSAPFPVSHRLVCHWCGHSERLPRVCPKCGEAEIHTLGLGTQKIEEAIREMFPSARTIRVDVDSMKGRRAFIEAWDKITKREADIILGTQMIAKGFHLESVTLVGVISADFALFLPDFRSAERTFQLLTQVAGRAGRGDLPGEVIVQSYLPHHYAIEHAARLDEAGFYEKELHIRQMLRFPPLFRLIGVLLTGEELSVARDQVNRLANLLKGLARRPVYESLKVLGPAPAPIGKIENQYRWRILLRGPAPKELHELLRQGLAAFADAHLKSKVNVVIDVDPVDLL